jgi:hypothetical protein
MDASVDKGDGETNDARIGMKQFFEEGISLCLALCYT